MKDKRLIGKTVLIMCLILSFSLTGCSLDELDSEDSRKIDGNASTNDDIMDESEDGGITASIVGTYYGEHGSILVFKDDYTAEYYYNTYEKPETGCHWKYEDGKLSWTSKEMGCDIYAQIENGNTQELFFVGSDAEAWDDEGYKKINGNGKSLSKDECDKLILNQEFDSSNSDGEESEQTKTSVEEILKDEHPKYFDDAAMFSNKWGMWDDEDGIVLDYFPTTHADDAGPVRVMYSSETNITDEIEFDMRRIKGYSKVEKALSLCRDYTDKKVLKKHFNFDRSYCLINPDSKERYYVIAYNVKEGKKTTDITYGRNFYCVITTNYKGTKVKTCCLCAKMYAYYSPWIIITDQVKDFGFKLMEWNRKI